MLKARYFLPILVLLTCLGAASHDDDSYSLIWKPTENQELRYELSTEMNADGHKLILKNDLHLKVTKIASNGDYTVETTQKNARAEVDGKEEKMPDNPDEKPQVEVYNAKGDKISKDEDSGEELDEMGVLLNSVGDFSAPEKPVKKGDKWTEEIKADSKTKVKAAKVSFEVLGTDKVDGYDVVKLSMSYKQTEGSKPASYEGTMAFDVKDMSLVQIDARLMDVPFDPETTGDVKLKLNRL